jgi:hypothetical protein
MTEFVLFNNWRISSVRFLRFIIKKYDIKFESIYATSWIFLLIMVLDYCN